ncbi:MAG: hypothetical protein M3Y13_03115 [Armatimonadota bacterium]|nr:hypothetical protein [Armatimonadota bacterium]
MELLYGVAARPGVAIAAAARLHDDFGVPSLAPDRLRRLGERLRSFGMENPEPEQIILIGERIPPGFWLSPLPGIEIVGLAVGDASPLLPPPDLPVVLGLEEAGLRTIEEDDILIVDGDRGRVYVAPDAATVARYQAPFTLSRRFFLEGSHLPARTSSDNRLITILCAARTLTEAENAMSSGADGLVVPANNDFLGNAALAQTAGEQAQTLGDLARIIGGQPLYLDIPPESLALTALARSAAHLPLHLVLRDLTEQPDIQERIEEIEAALEEEDALFGRVKLDAGISAAGEDDLPETLDGFAGIFVTETILESSWERLLVASGQARHASKPITLALNGDWWPQVLGDAVGMGFDQIIVPASAVADVKDAVREL